MRQQNINNENCLFGLTINSIYAPVLSICLLISMVGCNKSPNPDNKVVAMNSNNMHISEKTRKALTNIKNKRIYFMHHSVGRNILSGLKTLADETGVDLKIVNQSIQSSLPEKVFVDATGGKNKDPKSKVDSFAAQIKELNTDIAPDIAFMKFCFVDFNPYTDINEILSYYKKNIETLKNEKPDIKFAHLTIPLFAKPNSLKDKINRFLGRLVWEDSTNVKRAEFNKLLFENFPHDPIFDIARVESTLPDGTRSSFQKDGNTYYSLASEYTDDGGHLNALGQRRAAIELAEFLAAIPNTKK